MHNYNSHNIQKYTIYSGTPSTIRNTPENLVKSEFHRTNSDLIATTPEGKEIVFVDYFSNFELPSIITENGLLLKGSVLKALAGPLAKAQYVQATGDGALSIGEVSSVTGTVKATRLDGTTSNLNNGDPVFQGDTIETEGSGAVGLVFLDKTTLSLSDGGKMVLDELVYDPATGTGSMAVDMVEGAFSFVSGEIAKTGPDSMKVSTPVATIGIRGTTVAGKAAVEGNENSFTLLQDADGGVGQISVSNDGGTQVLAQVGATTSISSFTAPPPPPIILTPAQIQANYGAALNVLPPTPVVAPTPQAAPPPQEQQQEQQVQEEAQEENTEEEAASEEAANEEGEGPPEGEEGLEGEGPPEGEEGLEGEGPPEGEEGLEGEGPPEGEEGGPPVGPDGEPLPPGEDGPPVGPDGEPLPPGEGGPPVGPDGEPLPPGEGGP
ncbi:MAG: FecR domain-containing protein, partial [Alphaproteobacteria bacterium]